MYWWLFLYSYLSWYNVNIVSVITILNSTDILFFVVFFFLHKNVFSLKKMIYIDETVSCHAPQTLINSHNLMRGTNKDSVLFEGRKICIFFFLIQKFQQNLQINNLRIKCLHYLLQFYFFFFKVKSILCCRMTSSIIIFH